MVLWTVLFMEGNYRISRCGHILFAHACIGDHKPGNKKHNKYMESNALYGSSTDCSNILLELFF